MGLAALLCCVAATATADPRGTVSVGNLDFDEVAVGDSLDLAVTVRSVGDATLTGAILSGCSAFTVVTGGGAYALAPGASLPVVVRFKPTANGHYGCVLTTSSCACSNVQLSGQGIGEPEDPAVCDVFPSSIDFGTLAAGAVSSTTFRIKNTGGSVLSGTVAESCADYTIPTGGGAYSLGAGDSVVVTVRFTAPATDGTYPCTVTTGGAFLKGLATCSDVAATARVVTPQAICSVSPASLSFGIAEPDSAVDRTFRIKNTGTAGSSLSGTVSESCPFFSITAGSGDFTLAAGESVNVTVRFSASAESTFACTVGTGTNCAGVPCTASTVSGSTALLATSDLTYLGAFKFGGGGGELNYGGGRGMDVLPNGDLIICGTDDHPGRVRIATPAEPVIAGSVGSLNQAATVANITDITGGIFGTGNPPAARWEDIVVMSDRIVLLKYPWYDRNYNNDPGLGFCSLSYTTPVGPYFVGDWAVADGGVEAARSIWYQGKIAGYGVVIPPGYVENGRTLAIGRVRYEYGPDISAGPSLYFVDPDDSENNAVVALCYDQHIDVGENHPGPHSRPDYSLTDQFTDMAWVGGTILFAESKCLYPSHYGQPGQSGELGDMGACVESNAGYVCGHVGDGLPAYSCQLGFYRAADLVAASHGDVNYWEPLPYATLSLYDDMINPSCQFSLGGMAYDAAAGRLYVMQRSADTNERPICHVYAVAAP